MDQKPPPPPIGPVDFSIAITFETDCENAPAGFHSESILRVKSANGTGIKDFPIFLPNKVGPAGCDGGDAPTFHAYNFGFTTDNVRDLDRFILYTECSMGGSVTDKDNTVKTDRTDQVDKTQKCGGKKALGDRTAKVTVHLQGLVIGPL